MIFEKTVKSLFYFEFSRNFREMTTYSIQHIENRTILKKVNFKIKFEYHVECGIEIAFV